MLVVLLVTFLVRALVVQSFYVTSASMRPGLEQGDRITVDKTLTESRLRRGDVVVFDATEAFGVTSSAGAGPGAGLVDRAVGAVTGALTGALGIDLAEEDYVKRVVGLPGDSVRCCDEQGHLVVNDRAVEETYLATGEAPSDVEFDVLVPAGRVWVMGDHRSSSSDSRAHLGDAGGGMVPVDDIIGRASARYWPISRIGGIGAPDALTAIDRRDTP